MRRLVIGVGNPSRGDDAAGLEVARRLRRVEARRHPGASYELMDLWEGADDVIVVDAARSGAAAGTVHRYDARRQPLPLGTLATSTHSVGVADTVELARSLGRLPARLMIYGIEVGDLSTGAGLSPAVEESVQRTVEEIDGA